MAVANRVADANKAAEANRAAVSKADDKLCTVN